MLSLGFIFSAEGSEKAFPTLEKQCKQSIRKCVTFFPEAVIPNIFCE